MPRSFYIIDGHAQIFRAYYAPFRPLSSPTGEPTKATYVFAQALLNLIEQEKPEYLAMVIDTGNKDVFRTKLYPEYKANRKPAPDDFGPQADRILRMVADAGIPVIARPGFEADDIMATMARELANRDFRVVLVSKDKDLRQLVCDHVVLFDAATGKTLDAAAVEQEYGYPPAKAVEVQTLTGDATDNVPGVPGVGEKTAAKLIAKYGSVEEVVKHADEQTPKLKENLLKAAEILRLSRTLVTLRSDVPMDMDLECCKFAGVDAAGLRRHFVELGFTQLVKRIGGDEQRPPSPQKPAAADGLFGDISVAASQQAQPDSPARAAPAAQDGLRTTESCDYRLVNTPELFEQFMAELCLQREFAFDTETDALGAMYSNVVGLSFSWIEQQGWYVAVEGPLGAQVLDRKMVIERLRPIMENPQIGKFGHNAKYDFLAMRKIGLRVRGLRKDTMIAAFVLDSSGDSYSIDRLAGQMLGIRKIATQELIGSGKNQISMQQVQLEHVARYASEDADVCLRLARLLRPKLDEHRPLAKLYDDLENPLVEVLVEMEFAGVSVDPAILKQQSGVLGAKIDLLRKRLMEAAGREFNPDSPKQLAEVLFVRLGLPVIKRNKTGPSTDIEVLEKLSLEHEVPRLMLEHRSLVKLKNTYLDTLTAYVSPGTNRIHASFSQIGAETGRLSCNDPNLQNIPIRSEEGRAIRLAFVPQQRDRDVLLTADYSQIELRVLAHFTHEPALIRAFAADEDVHATVAAEVFGVERDKVSKEQRAQAKVVNFGIIYGISAFGLARRIDGLGMPAAGKLIEAYHARFPSIQRFLHECVEQAKKQGYVETILGRRRQLPQIHSAITAQRNAGERMAINSVVQGSAADLIKVAMLNIQRRIEREDRPIRMVMQVHDELVFETPLKGVEEQAQFVKQEMEKAMTLSVPLRADIGWGANWQEGK